MIGQEKRPDGKKMPETMEERWNKESRNCDVLISNIQVFGQFCIKEGLDAMIQNETHIKSSRLNSIVENAIPFQRVPVCFPWYVLPQLFVKSQLQSQILGPCLNFSFEQISPVQIGIQCVQWTCHLIEWSTNLLFRLFTVWVLGRWYFCVPLGHECTYHGWNPQNYSKLVLTLMKSPQAWKLTLDPETRLVCSPLMFPMGPNSQTSYPRTFASNFIMVKSPNYPNI